MEDQGPIDPAAEVMVEELGQAPGIFEFDDGSAIVGEYSEMEEMPEIAFDPNLADYGRLRLGTYCV